MAVPRGVTGSATASLAPVEPDHVDHLLAQWAEERPELPTGALAVAARVARLHRFLARTSARALTAFGLTEGEGNVLAALRRAGPPYALTPTELYRSLLLSSGAMTNRVDRLQDRGYVSREDDPEDRRRVLVRLTDEGREVIDAAMDAHVAALEEAIAAALPDDERDRLVGLLRRTLEAFEADDRDL